jgi:hypothetical protein
MRAPVRPVTGRLLVAGTVMMGALIAVPMVAGPTSSPTPAPAQSASAAVVPVSRTSAESQYSVLAQEDQRMLTLVGSVRPGSGPYVETLAGVDTLVLTAGGLPYDLGALRALGAAAVLEGGDVLLTTNILVAPGARLVLDAPGTTLRMRSGRSGFVSLVAWKADLVLSGAEGAPLRVSGWDVDAAGPDTVVEDGRAYIREVSGDMRLAHVGASYLGFWAGRTSGVAWTGSSRSRLQLPRQPLRGIRLAGAQPQRHGLLVHRQRRRRPVAAPEYGGDVDPVVGGVRQRPARLLGRPGLGDGDLPGRDRRR